jgi:predicted nucleic acid-binding protein
MIGSLSIRISGFMPSFSVRMKTNVMRRLEILFNAVVGEQVIAEVSVNLLKKGKLSELQLGRLLSALPGACAFPGNASNRGQVARTLLSQLLG